MSEISKDNISLLEQFVSVCRKNPDLLHSPELRFFREFILEVQLSAKRTAKAPPFVDDDGPPPLEKVDISKMKRNNKTEHTPNENVTEKGNPVKSEPSVGLRDVDMNITVTETMREFSQERKSFGVMEMKNENYEIALSHFSEAIRNNPRNALMWVKRARCLFEMKRWEDCVYDCTQAIQLNPDAVVAYRFRGLCLKRLNTDLDSAISDLKKANAVEKDTECEKELLELLKMKGMDTSKNQNMKNETKEDIETVKPKGGKSDGKIPEWLTPQLFEKVAKTPSLARSLQSSRVQRAIDEIAKDGSAFLKYQNDHEVLEAFGAFCGVMDEAGKQKN